MRNNNPRNCKIPGRCSGWFAKVFIWLVAANLLGSFLAPSKLRAALVNAIAKDEVAVTLKRTGKVPDSSLLSKRPQTGVVTDQSSWKSLWNAWRPGQEIPKVDFQNQIVLVSTADGPNVVLTSRLNLTTSGDLRYESVPGKRTGPGFGYALLIIPRAGILSVNGQKLSEQTLASRSPETVPSTTPQLPVPTTPQLPTLAKPRLPAPTKPRLPTPTKAKLPTPTMTSSGGIDESIWVEIRGRVRTGVISRGISTGTMIVANGVVWELDLRDDAQLTKAVKQLGTDIGDIKGTLSKLTNPDRSIRWVVNVESIGLASADKSMSGKRMGMSDGFQLGPPQSIRLQSIPPQSIPIQSRPSKIEKLTTDEAKAVPEFGKESPQLDQPAAGMTSMIPASGQTGFESIVISATGGRSSLERKQIVAADGTVTLEVPKTNYSESFSLAPDSLLQLHQFVASTDWNSVPRKSTGSASKGVTNFSITVETKNGTKRFFCDETSVGSQPVISKLFSLMQKPKKDQ